jgi:hypothetical protein
MAQGLTTAIEGGAGMSTEWPFDDPPDVATISLRDIMESRQPILLVSHDAEDGMWQFLDGRADLNPDDAVVLSLADVLGLDRSIAQLADLPLGWRAWRANVNQPWQREPME